LLDDDLFAGLLDDRIEPELLRDGDRDVAGDILVDGRHRSHLDELGDDVFHGNDHRGREFLHGEQVGDLDRLQTPLQLRLLLLALLLPLALLLEQQLLLAILLGGGLLFEIARAIARTAAGGRRLDDRRNAGTADRRARAGTEGTERTVADRPACGSAGTAGTPAGNGLTALLARDGLPRPPDDARTARDSRLGPRRRGDRGRRRRSGTARNHGALTGRDRAQAANRLFDRRSCRRSRGSGPLRCGRRRRGSLGGRLRLRRRRHGRFLRRHGLRTRSAASRGNGFQARRRFALGRRLLRRCRCIGRTSGRNRRRLRGRGRCGTRSRRRGLREHRAHDIGDLVRNIAELVLDLDDAAEPLVEERDQLLRRQADFSGELVDLNFPGCQLVPFSLPRRDARAAAGASASYRIGLPLTERPASRRVMVLGYHHLLLSSPMEGRLPSNTLSTAAFASPGYRRFFATARAQAAEQR